MRGTAFVVAATGCPSGASSAPCRMNLAVSVPGQPSVAVEKTLRAAAKRWPMSGMTLPIEVDRADFTRLRVLWDEVPTGRERSADAAARLIAQLNGSPDGTQPPASPVTSAAASFSPASIVQTSSVMINGREASLEEIAQYEALTGMDLNGDGVVGAAAAPATRTRETAGAGDGEGRLEALERLAALRAAGALSAAEFEAEKQRILEG